MVILNAICISGRAASHGSRSRGRQHFADRLPSLKPYHQDAGRTTSLSAEAPLWWRFEVRKSHFQSSSPLRHGVHPNAVSDQISCRIGYFPSRAASRIEAYEAGGKATIGDSGFSSWKRRRPATHKSSSSGAKVSTVRRELSHLRRVAGTSSRVHATPLAYGAIPSGVI